MCKTPFVTETSPGMEAYSGRQQTPGRHAIVLLAIACLAASLPATCGAAVGSTATASAAAADPVATMRRLAGELDLQRELPGEKREDTPSDLNLRIPGASTILWVALAVGLAFALWALRDTIPFLRRRNPDGHQDTALAPDTAAVARMAEAGDDADELAGAGRIAEAMHLLLLRALAEMRSRLRIALADSLTSREILRTVALPDDGRRALSELIGRVERVHFGAKPATLDDYGACRATFERLVGAMLVPQPAA